MERWTYNYAHDSEGILDAALDMYGLDRRYLFKILSIPFDPAKNWNANNISAGEWFYLCQGLGLSADSITWGYSKQEHLARLSNMLETGVLTSLPRTTKVRALIRQAKLEAWKEARYRWKHYGLRYCLKLEINETKKRIYRSLPKILSNFDAHR